MTPLQPFVQGRRALDARVEPRGAPLADFEFDTLSWLCLRWHSDGADPAGRVAFTLAEIADDISHSERGRREPKAYAAALDALQAATVTIAGYNAVTYEFAAKFISRVHVIRKLDVNRRLGDRGDSVTLAAVGDESYNVTLEDWLTGGLSHRHVIRLTSQLSGVEIRLEGRGTPKALPR